MKTVIAILGIVLTGCGGLPADPTNMSPEQITALAKDRSASAACTLVTTPWGPQRTLYVSLDKSAISSGGVTVTPDCQMSIQSDPALPRVVPNPANAPAQQMQITPPAANPLTCYWSGPQTRPVWVCEHPVR